MLKFKKNGRKQKKNLEQDYDIIYDEIYKI